MSDQSILSAANSSKNLLIINQTPALQTDFIPSNFDNERFFAFSERIMALEMLVANRHDEGFSYGTELTEWNQIQPNCSQPAVESNGKFWTE